MRDFWVSKGESQAPGYSEFSEEICAQMKCVHGPSGKRLRILRLQGKIHTDFEKGRITAEVMKYEDFRWEGSENAVKAAGKYRQQSRNYIEEDIILKLY
ncbi:ribosome-binding ATPase YchF-like [Pongo pygmaeus]|uniref:ribosome-binding ATPase YchF-like n=1 Tax=Pongo pygmaeus TaxID=9600 RepID=UPI00300C8C57